MKPTRERFRWHRYRTAHPCSSGSHEGASSRARMHARTTSREYSRSGLPAHWGSNVIPAGTVAAGRRCTSLLHVAAGRPMLIDPKSRASSERDARPCLPSRSYSRSPRSASIGASLQTLTPVRFHVKLCAHRIPEVRCPPSARDLARGAHEGCPTSTRLWKTLATHRCGPHRVRSSVDRQSAIMSATRPGRRRLGPTTARCAASGGAKRPRSAGST